MIRFQADADLNQGIVLTTIRRPPTLDFQSATGAGLPGPTGWKIRARAANQCRLLAAHDVCTMPHHFSDYIRDNHGPGVIVVP